MSRTLYLCYFGLHEPLVQTQVLPYLRELRKMDGMHISLLTFEPDFRRTWTPERIEADRGNMAEEGIDWHCLGYHKWPSVPATAWDVIAGCWYVRKLMRKENFDILHARVHLPALMAAIARKFSRRRPKLLFDFRGFFPEEYTDAGVWPENGWLFRSAKRVERWLMKEADGFVVLTEKARQILFPESKNTGFDKLERPVAVIPCCADFSRFGVVRSKAARAEMRRRLGVGDRTVIAYVGSFGGWYLSREMFDFLKTALERDPKVFVLILTQRDKEKVIANLHEAGFEEREFLVESVKPGEIPEYLAAADFAISFIKRCYSKQASSPTKIAEYLACGLPIVANPGVGDIDDLIRDDHVGTLLEGFDKAGYLKALVEIEGICADESGIDRCTRSANRRFDLKTVGGPEYRSLYTRLLGIR